MCRLNVAVNNNYVVLNINKRTIRQLVSPVLKKYLNVINFDKQNGVITLEMLCELKNGTIVTDEDWIDLNELLGFSFKNPRKIIDSIDEIVLV